MQNKEETRNINTSLTLPRGRGWPIALNPPDYARQSKQTNNNIREDVLFEQMCRDDALAPPFHSKNNLFK